MSGTRIYVGHLSHRASERDIEYFFRGYGKIREIVIKNGFGFVEFDDHRDSEDAVYDLNGKDLCGDRVILEHVRRPPKGRDADRAYQNQGRYSRDYGRRGYGGGGGGGGRELRYPPPQQTRHRLIVENLSTRCSWQELKDMLRDADLEVTFTDAHRTKRNEGVVCFGSHSDLEKAMEKFEGKDINGRKIHLVDDSRSSRSRSRSRTRSRSRSRSADRKRSRSRSGDRKRSRSRSGSRKRSRSRSGSRKSGGDKEDGDKPERNGDTSPARSEKGEIQGIGRLEFPNFQFTNGNLQIDRREGLLNNDDKRSRSRSGSPPPKDEEEDAKREASGSPAARSRSGSRSRSRSRD